MAIPFKSLRFTSMDMQTWGFAFFRNIPARNENSFWPSVTNRVNGVRSAIRRPRWLRQHLARPQHPADSLHRGVERASAGPASGLSRRCFRTNRDVRVGMDAKLVIRESLTLDVTINPDFSQVESDDPQVTVNQRFEVFFPEKRPFFLENASYFQTPENLFFSRRIGDPLGGARLTGRIGRWSIGLLAGADRGPGKQRRTGRSSLGRLRARRRAAHPAKYRQGIHGRRVSFRLQFRSEPQPRRLPGRALEDRQELGGRGPGHRQRHAVSGRHAFRGSGVRGVSEPQRAALQLLRQLSGPQSGVSYRPGVRAAHGHPHDPAERQL